MIMYTNNNNKQNEAQRSKHGMQRSVTRCSTANLPTKILDWSKTQRGDPNKSSCVFPRESDTQCAVLQFRILLDGKSKWADGNLRGHPPFRSEACENIV